MQMPGKFIHLLSLSVCFSLAMVFGPAQEILELFASASSDSSGESAHTRSLARAITTRMYTRSKEEGKCSDQE